MPTDPSRASNAFITICTAIDTYLLNLPEKCIQWHLNIYTILPFLPTKRYQNMRQNTNNKLCRLLTIMSKSFASVPILLETTRRKAIWGPTQIHFHNGIWSLISIHHQVLKVNHANSRLFKTFPTLWSSYSFCSIISIKLPVATQFAPFKHMYCIYPIPTCCRHLGTWQKIHCPMLAFRGYVQKLGHSPYFSPTTYGKNRMTTD